jgi:vacuolar-type H+-ATPase subunit E/Vma4
MGCRLGGVVLVCHFGQIVYDNTFEQRVDLAMQGTLPAIRSGMFPNLQDIDFSK